MMHKIVLLIFFGLLSNAGLASSSSCSVPSSIEISEVHYDRSPVKPKKKKRSSDWEEWMFGAGAILALLGLFAVILFHWIGGWAFLIALGIIGIGYGLMLIAAANAGRRVSRSMGIGIAAMMALDILGFLIWGIVGLFIWLL